MWNQLSVNYDECDCSNKNVNLHPTHTFKKTKKNKKGYYCNFIYARDETTWNF